MSYCNTAVVVWFGGGCNEVWVVNAVVSDEEPMIHHGCGDVYGYHPFSHANFSSIF